MEEKKLFFGQLNSDNNDYSLPKDNYLNGVNIEILNPDSNGIGDVKAIGGNRWVGGKLPYGSNKVIGSCEDAVNQRIIYMVVNVGAADTTYIIAHDIATETNITVLRLNDFQFGDITYSQTDSIDSMVVKGDFLLWASEGHPPYKLNINRAIKRNNPSLYPDIDAYEPFITPRDIELVKKPPVTAPYLDASFTSNPDGSWDYKENYRVSSGEINNLGGNSYVFATRFIYSDGEISVLSPYSKMVQPKKDNESGSYINVKYTNLVESPDFTISIFDVIKVELIVKYGNDGGSFIIDSIDPEDYLTAVYKFYNTTIGTALSDDYVAKDSESIPIESESVESVNNRIVLGANLDLDRSVNPTTLRLTPHYMFQDYGDDLLQIGGSKSYNKTYNTTYRSIRVLETKRIWGYDGNDGGELVLWFHQLAFTYDNGSSWYINTKVPVQNINGNGLKIYSSDYSDLQFSSYHQLELIPDADKIFNGFVPYVKSGTFYERRKFTDLIEYDNLPIGTYTVFNVPFPINGYPDNRDIVYKSDSEYKFGIAFYDHAKRKSFVSVAQDTIRTPKMQFNFNPGYYDENIYKEGSVNYIEWELNDDFAASEIPYWADTYQIVRTKSLTHSAFTQFYANEILFYYKPSDDIANDVIFSFTFDNEFNSYWDSAYNPVFSGSVGEYNLANSRTWYPFFKGFAVPLSFLNNKGFGYTYTRGDTLTIARRGESAGVKYTVDFVSGGYVFVKANGSNYPKPSNGFPMVGFSRSVATDTFWEQLGQGFGQIDSGYETEAKKMIINQFGLFLCEIQTPAIVSPSDYYEVSEIFSVNKADLYGVGNYNTTSGKLRGDTYLQSGEIFGFGLFINEVTNRGNSNISWDTDAMRRNKDVKFISDLSENIIKTSLKWSGNYIYGTKVNNIASFNAFDEEILSGDIGSIQKLVFTSKISEYGNVLLVIGETATLSVYIDENILTDTEGSEQVQQSTKFIGSIRELKGNYGTLHPESVVEYKGNVYWWDEINKTVVRYSQAGLSPVSDNAMTSFFRKINTKSLKMYGGFDPQTDEYFLTVPAINSNTIEYPSDWSGSDICDDVTVTGWGDGFTVSWGNYTCVQTAVLTWSVVWGNYTCVVNGISFPQIEWGNYACVQRDSSSVFYVSWGNYTCVQEIAQFNVAWGNYTCVQYNDSGSYTALWDGKVCVNVEL